MKHLLALIVVVITGFLAFFLSYLALAKGWGLEVKSWGWVIGIWFTGIVNFGILSIASSVLKEKD